MVVWSLVAYAIIILSAGFLIWKRQHELPVFVNGMIPALPHAESLTENGSTVYLFFSDTHEEDEGRDIFRGFANDKGVVHTTLPLSSVGRPVTIRIRHDGLKFEDTEILVKKHGLFFTARLLRDVPGNQPVPGSQVKDLAAHFRRSTVIMERLRTNALGLAQSLQQKVSFVPILYWLIFYTILIVGFALDYWMNSGAFSSSFESFWHATYFSVVTITTLGYGDLYPTSDLMRMLCSFESVSGIVIIGLFLNSLVYENRP